MTPWVPGYAATDQYSSWSSLYTMIGTPHKILQLPWQSFPAFLLYASFLACLVLHLCLQLELSSYVRQLPYCQSDAQPRKIALCCLDVLAVVAGCILAWIASCAALFVGFIYWHCRACVSRGYRADCTKFVRFRDPAMHVAYAGRAIDMETLYEMYFDEKLDFVMPSDGANSADPERAACLMNDILSRRHEFVDYTFGLTTHLRFLLLQWIPSVILHSRGQDKSQVRDHYDRSKFYSEKNSMHATDLGNPFTSDEAEDDFFGMFLGPAMVYTSGIVSNTSHQETLEQMQDNKLKLICRKLKLVKVSVCDGLNSK